MLLIKISLFARFNWVYLILSWTTIFAVKFGFLVFFEHLVRGLPDIFRYGKGVVTVTAVGDAFSLVDGVIACPMMDLRLVRFSKLSPSRNNFSLISVGIIVSCSVQHARAIGATAIGLEILTDLLSTAPPSILPLAIPLDRRSL